MEDRRSFRDYFDDLTYDTYFEINGQMIGLLPKFKGANRDNPLDHLRDLLCVCNTLRTRNVDEEDFLLRMLPYSLVSDAKSWMFSLYVDSRLRWKQMQQLFLKKYSVKQHPQETTYHYLKRFGIHNTCPNHSVTEDIRIISFLDGMNLDERKLMDLMAGGDILDHYPDDIWELIYDRAADSRLAEILEADAKRQSSLQKSQTEPVAQPLVQQVMETNLEVESIEQVCKDEESMSPPTPILLKGVTLSHLVDDKEEDGCEQDINETSKVLQVVPTTCNTDINIDKHISSQCSVTTTEQGIILYTPNILLVPNLLLSSQIQEDKHKTPNEERDRDSLDKVTTQGPLIHICKQKSIYKRSRDEVCMNRKTYKKAKRMTMDEEASSFFVPMQRRHASFGWKPGWDLCRSAISNRATKNMRHSWKKFDGAHPWAPNI